MFSINYRPKSLQEIIGHEKIIKEIIRRFENDNFPQVSYFTGITGSGKTTFAMNIAKIIQCENKINKYTPCNECKYCKDINEEEFTLGTYMFNASNLDIETMRDIEELANVSSWVSTKKVFIIDELQELSTNKKAMKNVLKTLEKKHEGDVYFILLSMDDSKVDKAIKNRSVMYKLFPLHYAKIAEYLYEICTKKLGIDVDEEKSEVLITIAENSFGSIRQSLSLLERVVSGNIWTLEEVREQLRFVTLDDLTKVVKLFIERSPRIFNLDLDEELIFKVKNALIKLSKYLIGCELDEYEKKLVSEIIHCENVGLKNINFIIQTLNEVYKYSYLNKDIIESIIIKLFTEEEKNEDMIENKNENETTIVKRRRKPLT